MCHRRHNIVFATPMTMDRQIDNPFVSSNQLGYVNAYDYDYEYCPNCGHRMHRCRCSRRGGGRRDRRRQGPITMLIGGIVHMVEEHQAKKEERRRIEGEEFANKLRSDESERQREGEAESQRESGTEEHATPEESRRDDVVVEEEEQRGKSGKWEDAPPSYHASTRL